MVEMIAVATFIVLLVIAGASDIRSRRIPNSVVALTAVLGVGYAVAELGASAGALSAFGGIGVGLIVWLPCYAIGMLGAGDVKFFAAGAAWVGPQPALYAAAVAAIFGGVLAIGWAVWLRSHGSRVAGSVDRAPTSESMLVGLGAARERPIALPYGVAMSVGLGLAAWVPHVLQ